MTLNALFLENDKDDAKNLSRWIGDTWQQENPNVPIEFQFATSVDEAIAWLEENHGHCDIIFVDLDLSAAIDSQENDASTTKGGRTQPGGEHAIRYAKRYHGIAIIVVSQLDQPEIQRALDKGAHAYLSKDVLTFDYKDEYVLERLTDALGQVGKIPFSLSSDVAFEYDQDDIHLASLIDTLGRETILAFSAKLTDFPLREVRPIYVRPGLSGAIALVVELAFDREPTLEVASDRLFIKFDRDLARLESEYANYKRLERIASGMRVETVGIQPQSITASGWHACAHKIQ